MHRLTESDLDKTSQFQNGGHDIFSPRKVLCCHLVTEKKTKCLPRVLCSNTPASSRSIVHSCLLTSSYGHIFISRRKQRTVFEGKVSCYYYAVRATTRTRGHFG